MKFPIKKYKNTSDFTDDYFQSLFKASIKINKKELEKIIDAIEKNYKSNLNKTFVCGNGGSTALANHFACDHQKILFETNKIKPNVISLSSNGSLMTAISNDNSFERVFEDQIKYYAKKNDILFVISSSGNSRNVVNAIKLANKKKLITISLTGFDGGTCRKISKFNIHVPSKNYGIIEATHHSIMNIISQYIKNKILNKKEILRTIF